MRKEGTVDMKNELILFKLMQTLSMATLVFSLATYNSR